MNESCHTYEWVMSHIWMSHVTHMNESCHTYEWRLCVWALVGGYGICVTWMCDMTHSRVTLTHVCHVTYVWVMSYMNESCHTWMSHVTYVWVMSHMYESCHICIHWPMTHSCKCTGDTLSFATHMNESCHTCDGCVCVCPHGGGYGVMGQCHAWMSHITYSCHTYEVMSHV